jgi:hypothetical protein
MSFPTSPVNNQTTATNNVLYSYNSTDGAWNRVGALASSTSLGDGQTWQVFTVGTQRINGTTYTNSTGRPIFVSIRGGGSGDAGGDFYIDSVIRAGWYASASNAGGWGGGIVPNGSTYKWVINLGGNISTWSELR